MTLTICDLPICSANRWAIKVNAEELACKGRAGGRTVDNLTQQYHSLGRLFSWIGRLFRTGFGNQCASANVLFSQPETPVTKQAATAAPLRPPHPALFSDSATSPRIWWRLSLRSATRRRTPRRSIERRDQLIQSMPDASPAKWTAATPPGSSSQFLPARVRQATYRSSGLRVPVQSTMSAPAPHAPTSAPYHPPGRGGYHRLPRPCRRGVVKFFRSRRE